MSSIDKEWVIDRLKDIAVVNGSSLPADTDLDYQFDYLEISNVDYNGIVDINAIEHLRYEDAPSRARRVVSTNSTVISTVRPNLQAIAFAIGIQSDFVCSTGFNVVEPKPTKFSPKFCYYALISENARQYFEAVATGVGYPAVGDKEFNAISIPFPSLLQQQRIAAYLDASCSVIDAAVAAKRRQLETIDALRREAYHSAFSPLLSGLIERIKDVSLKISSGVTPDGGATSYLDSGIPFLRSQNIHFEGLRLDDVAYISEDTHNEMNGSQLKPKDVLVNITGASIGRCTFVPEDFEEGNVNQHVCIMRTGHRLDYKFLTFFLSSPMGQDQIFSSFTGASRQGLSHKDLGLIRIPLPGLEVQKTICASLKRKFEELSRITKGIEDQITTLIAYRKSLIHECVTGQRKITEADLKKAKQHG